MPRVDGNPADPPERGEGLLGVVLPTLFALALGLMFLGLAWREQQQRWEEARYAKLARDANTISLAIRDRIATYSLVLRGARALFSTGDQLNRRSWRQYVEGLNLYRDYPGVAGLGFCRDLRPDEIPAHEAALRAEGQSNYRVWPSNPGDRVMAVTYLEPENPQNLRVLGYDAASHPDRRAVMLTAEASGEPALSGKVSLQQGDAAHPRPGALLFLGLNNPAGTQGRNFFGWVYGAFQMEDLILSVLGGRADGLRVQIFDGDRPSADALLFDNGNPIGSKGVFPVASGTSLRYENPMLVAGRRWTLVFELPPGAGLEQPGFGPDLAVVAFLAISMVVGTGLLFNARRQARRLRQLGESVRLREAQYGTLVNLSRDGICAVDRDMRLTFVNPRLAEWIGRPAAALVGASFFEFFQADPHGDPVAIRCRLESGDGQTYQMRLVGGSGPDRVVLVSDQPLRGPDDEFLGATMVLTDVTEREVAAERIHFLATHDVLTGVANRLSIRERLVQALALAHRYGRRVGLLFIDLDYFKEVNDSFGHGVGDQVLMATVDRIREGLRSSDSVGRLGGDEFLVILPELESPRAGRAVASKIIEALERPILVADKEIRLSASIGFAIYPEDGLDDETLVSRADAAMYRAKCAGRGRVEGGGENGA
ncbi:MAG: diguanylate cyclase [Zoogloeaceae bacterium]|nr:diguanylate cyclase [Zoogloeaceae bacterium]